MHVSELVRHRAATSVAASPPEADGAGPAQGGQSCSNLMRGKAEWETGSNRFMDVLAAAATVPSGTLPSGIIEGIRRGILTGRHDRGRVIESVARTLAESGDLRVAGPRHEDPCG